VWFYTAGDDGAGGVLLWFSSTVQYRLGWCSSFSPFPTQPPSNKEKVWRITLSRTAVIRVSIHCSNVEVLNLLISTCSDSRWSNNWTKDVEKIRFSSADTASDHYRPGNYNVFSVRTITVIIKWIC
jgi:hypothetical protein